MKPIPLSYIKSSGEYNWVNNPFTEFVTSTVDKNSNADEIQKERNRKLNRERYQKKTKCPVKNAEQ